MRRFDTASFGIAKRTREGFIEDTPVVSRVGIFEYADSSKPGGIRRELRPPEEVFSAAHLESLRGKPITFGHVKGLQNGRTDAVIGFDGKPWHAIGSSTSAGQKAPNGTDVLTDCVIYHTDAIDKYGLREISLGYTLDLDETPGVWEGQPYDAVQRNLRVDHIAVVERGRAKTARFNLDAADISFAEEPGTPMVQVRLTNGVSYDVVPEVAAELATLGKERQDAATQIQQLTAARDAAQADLVKQRQDMEDNATALRAQLRSRMILEDVAKSKGVDVRADATDRALQEAVIRKVRGDSIDLKGKPDAYVQALFDITQETASTQERKDTAAAQLSQGFGVPVKPAMQGQREDTAENAHAAMVADMTSAYTQGGDK